MNRELIGKYEEYENANYRIFSNYLNTFVFWLFVFVGVCLTAMVGLTTPEEDDIVFFAYLYGLFNLLQMSNWQRVRYTVVENNRLRNFFSKLLYVPVNLKMYFVTKAYRMVKYFMAYAGLMQLLAMLIHVIYNGGFRLMWITFMPLISGAISTVVCVALLWAEYRKAVKEI